MTVPRILLYGATWCPDEEKRAVATLWARSLEKIAPGIDVLVIDCNSPFRPGAFLKPLGFSEITTPLGEWTYCPDVFSGNKTVVSFADNVGHLSLGQGDGWGRSFCKGIEIAIAGKYDYAVYIEPDLLFGKPVMPIIEKMHRSGVKVACPMDLQYHFINNEIMFMNVEYLREIDFVGQYDWKNPPPASFEIIPERRCETIMRDELFILPLRGLRNDFHYITPQNLSTGFPMGIDWITHCKNFAVYEEFARLKELI